LWRRFNHRCGGIIEFYRANQVDTVLLFLGDEVFPAAMFDGLG
jgi:hypothetical protein